MVTGRSEDDLTDIQHEWLSRDTRLRVVLLVVAPVLTLLTLVLTSVVVHSKHPDQPIKWSLLIGLGSGMVILQGLAILTGLKLRKRSTVLRNLVVSGDRPTIRRVSKQLRRGQAVADQDLPVARAVVDVTRRQRWVPFLFAGVAVINLLPLVEHPTPAKPTWLIVLQMGAAVLILAAVVLLVISRRRVLRTAERFHITPQERDRP